MDNRCWTENIRWLSFDMELNQFLHEMDTAKDFLYHGSSAQGIDILKPIFKLHNSDKKVIYLTSNLPYALVYIWDSIKTGTNQKWVTCGLKNGIVYYEEQFPNQLKEFYEGVEGYIYAVPKGDTIQGVEKREQMYFSTNPLSVTKTIYVPDVYQALCKCQQKGTFQLSKFTDATSEKQQQLIDMISDCIKQSGALNANNEDSHFFQRYFKEAWKKANSGE